MTDPAAGLLHAIVRDPDDTWLRLICADWLEEHGEVERAEFIRVQCRLVDLVDQPCPRCDGDGQAHGSDRPFEWSGLNSYPGACPVCHGEALRRRERELLRAHYPRWIGPVLEAFGVKGGGFGTGWNNLDSRVSHESFRRGFVESVACTCADWLKHGAQIVQAQPVREVRLTDKEPLDGNMGPTLPRFWHWLTIRESLAPFMEWEAPFHWREHFASPDQSYESHEAAEADLSRAARAWARQQAGLPALEDQHAQ